jgi:hypothetical protein
MARRRNAAPESVGLHAIPIELLDWFAGKGEPPVTCYMQPYHEALAGWWRAFKARNPRAPLPPGVDSDALLRRMLGVDMANC